MTDVQDKTKTRSVTEPHPGTIAIDSETAAGVLQFMGPMVVDLEALVINSKQAHWHVRGPNFIGIHLLLDDVVAHAQEWADLAAERIVALGLPVDSRISTVGAKNTLPEMDAGFLQTPDMVAQVVAQFDAALKTVHTAVDELEDIDLNSQDVAIEIERGMIKDRWFLEAHIAN